MVASISSARSVAIRVFAFRYAGYGDVVGFLLLVTLSMAAFMFVARSFASPVMRSSYAPCASDPEGNTAHGRCCFHRYESAPRLEQDLPRYWPQNRGCV